jgi:hypothetical protein
MMVNSFGFDPESIIQDADIEMMELRQAAEQAECNRKHGTCDHGWTGPAKKPEHPGQFECYDCGHTWTSREARDKEETLVTT